MILLNYTSQKQLLEKFASLYEVYIHHVQSSECLKYEMLKYTENN